MILFYILLLLIGFIALIRGADTFVDGSSALARAFKVPGLIIGLTIVALGTSAPELAVSTSAAIQGSNEIALSNVIGSNIFNLLCVLGMCAIIHPVPVDKGIIKRDFPISIIATVFLLLTTGSAALSAGISLQSMDEIVGNVSRGIAAILFIAFIVYIVYLIVDARKNPSVEEQVELKPIYQCIILLILGLVMIVVGGQAVVYSAKEVARFFGMSETLIGLTIVAVGTSLPELVTSVVAARKGETGLAVGNVIGSNIFNLMFILGVSALINPIGVNVASILDLIILIAVSVVSFVFAMTSKEISRKEGIAMILIYIVDVIFAAIR